MATLARVDVDAVDLPYLKLDEGPSSVSARPSREFSAVTDPTLELPMPERTPWLGKTLFVSAMVGIIAAASVTAVRNNADEPWLAPWLHSAQSMLPITSEPAAREAPSAVRPELLRIETADALARPEPTAASVQATKREEAAALLPGLAEPSSERVRLPEVVFVNPEPSLQKHAATAARPNKAGHVVRGRGKAKVAARAKAAPAAAPVAPAVALGSWDKARELARTAYAEGRYRDAAAAYEQAARLNPRHGLTLAGLGAARAQLGDAAGAVDAYKRAVATAPANLTFQLGLARAYEKAGDEARARDTYQRVLKLDRDNVAAQSGLDRL